MRFVKRTIKKKDGRLLTFYSFKDASVSKSHREKNPKQSSKISDSS